MDLHEVTDGELPLDLCLLRDGDRLPIHHPHTRGERLDGPGEFDLSSLAHAASGLREGESPLDLRLYGIRDLPKRAAQGRGIAT